MEAGGLDHHVHAAAEPTICDSVGGSPWPPPATLTSLPLRDDQDDDDNDDDDVPISSSSTSNRATVAFCQRCHGRVGEFFNSWHKVAERCYLPTLLGSYSSLLTPHGRREPAMDTVLNECTIQPLACPGCQLALGFHIVSAPLRKRSFRDRDFFYLSHIDLRCKVAPNQYITVQPHLDTLSLPSSPLVDYSPVSATCSLPSSPDKATMEVDSRPAPPLSGPRHHYHQRLDQHHHHIHHHQPPQNHHQSQHHQPQQLQLHQIESRKLSLPQPSPRSPPAPVTSNTLPQPSPSSQPIPLPSPVVGVKPIQHVQEHAQQPHKDPNTNMTSRIRDPAPTVGSHANSPTESRNSGLTYPRPSQEVQLDAIERLQTQISQNSSALVVHGRDMRRYEDTLQHQDEGLRRELQSQYHHQNSEIRRVDEAVGRLQLEMRGIRESMEALSRDVRRGATAGQAPTPAPSVSAQDSALELMAQQVAVISHRTNEIDTLKITIEIMKNKIQRLEDTAAATPVPAPSQAASRPYASPASQPSHAPAAYQPPPAQANKPVLTSTAIQRQPSYQSHHSHGSPMMVATPEAPQRVEPPPSQAWASVNGATKRTLVNGFDSPQESTAQAPTSPPKRLKLAPIEPRGTYASAGAQLSSYEYADSDSDAARVQSHSYGPASQPHPSQSETTLASQHPHATLASYGTPDAHSDDGWRHMEMRTPRSRGRGGGGPGSRGGRVRKSVAHLHGVGTPEWERESWQGVSQISPDGFYIVNRPTRGIVRRGSGGGGSSRGGRPPSSHGRTISLGLQGVTAGVGIGLPADPYAHTKKTRSKPVRNADGILIRKDGRPDMRSQSSAANLRKVHARKEDGSPGPEGTTTPSNLQHASSADAETPSPRRYAGQDMSDSMEKRHSHVLHKMFPDGIEKSRQEHDYARKVFDEDQDHTVHPRAQNHLHKSQHPEEADAHYTAIKNEQISRVGVEDNEDVDMDRPEDQADDEGQTPGGQSDNSGNDSQYHDPANGDEQTPPQAKESVKTAEESPKGSAAN
ncbi:unnamed protein product [Periconia digitata]|uniref:Uncharacterized protein n=1 Tax=Periconia digitata TaxID=1303443 RepID=A0A9W4XI50_9PLEO|nr:unnamed protein product [Periconia digitata]